MLLGLAVALFGFIFLFERRMTEPDPAPQRLLAFRPDEVTNIQLRLTNQLVLCIERPRTDAAWRMTVPPINYPAQPVVAEWLLQSLAEAVPQAEIAPQELKAARRTIAEFGLDLPQAAVTLQHDGERTEILFGAKTPVGDGVYVQVVNRSPIYVLSADLVNRLPRNYNDWREASLFPSTVVMNRMEVRTGGRGFTVDIDRSRGSLVLTKPITARADPAKFEVLLRRLLSTQILRFITDSPRADPEPYGLQPPEAEIAFLAGSNEQYTTQFAVQFGKSPTNEPSTVYARRLTTTNIVLVPRAVLDSLQQISHGDLRDLHLANFQPNAVDAIEVSGTNQLDGFVVRRQTNGAWMITEPRSELADTNSVREWLDVLLKLEGTVEKDVVTDFTTPYGLNPPSRRYVLRMTATNASGMTSNLVIGEVDLGHVQDQRVFARRPDETTVYSLSLPDVARLPRAAWQLRDRRVWSFTTNQVSRVTVRSNGESKTLQRNPNASWSLVAGQGAIPTVNPLLEETLQQLGELRAVAWINQGETNRSRYGFNDASNKISIELKNGEKPRTLTLEFGGPSPAKFPPYALALVDDQAWIFEFPSALFINVHRDLLGNSLFRDGQ